MTSEGDNDQQYSISIPVGLAVAVVILLGAAAAAYFIMGRGSETVETHKASRGRSGASSSWLRRLGLVGLIALIENGATRKVVVAVLKALARRR